MFINYINADAPFKSGADTCNDIDQELCPHGLQQTMTIITSKIIHIGSTRLCDCTFMKFNPVSYLPENLC
jgi:hypothetical protein